MYIQLGKITSKYVEPTYDDFMVLCEIVDSSLSYEKPILVHTENELCAWFGKNFGDYNYLLELLNQKVSLLLYKPISGKSNGYLENWVNLQNFIEDARIYSSEGEIDNPSSNFIYKIANSGGYYTGENGLSYSKFVWYMGDFVDISDLPQSNTIDSDSLNNRDTLRLLKNSEINYTYPNLSYNGSEIDCNMDEKHVAKNLQDEITSLNLEGVKNESRSLVYSLNMDNSAGANLREETYHLIINNQVFYSGPKSLWNDEESYLNLVMPDGKIIPKSIYGGADGKRNCHRITKFSDILDILGGMSGYYTSGNKLYTLRFTKNTRFYNIPGLSVTPLFDETWNIISFRLKDLSSLSLWSKTIGRDGSLEDDININVTKISSNYYQLVASRYKYEEVFEGSLDGVDYERLDAIINRSSKLIGCRIDDSSNIPEGSWVMKRAKPEIATPDMFIKSLSYIIDYCNNIFPDFLLVPKPENYTTSGNLEDAYKLLLDFSTNSSAQILIENTADNLEFNYTLDSENRLVYFWKDFYVSKYDSRRPGYYTFLLGLLSDINSYSTTSILYESPLSISKVNPYSEIEKKQTIIPLLSNMKSNYMIDNGQMYYYEQYQNGDNPVSSIWMRFCLGKVYRELEKSKCRIVGERSSYKIRTDIETSLNKITSAFSIIRSISIDGYFLDLGANTLYLQLTTYLSDLIDDNVTIDLTITFNKTNTVN